MGRELKENFIPFLLWFFDAAINHMSPSGCAVLPASAQSSRLWQSGLWQPSPSGLMNSISASWWWHPIYLLFPLWLSFPFPIVWQKPRIKTYKIFFCFIDWLIHTYVHICSKGTEVYAYFSKHIKCVIRCVYNAWGGRLHFNLGIINVSFCILFMLAFLNGVKKGIVA